MRTDTSIQVGQPPKPARQPKRRRLLPSWALKSAMAISGVIWAAFVAIHLFGNLKVFQGADAFNHYALWLREAFYPLLPKESVLWALRVVLALSLVVHVASAGIIWARARKARGPHRAKIRGAQAWGAWLMPITGITILAFIVVHILDLTLGTPPTASASFAHPDGGVIHAYENLVASFQRPAMAWFYAAVMVLLAVHIAKGFVTMASDLGVMGRRLRATLVVVGGLLAVAILLGNAAIPLLVQAGVIS